MESLNILFTGQDAVETRREPVPPVQAGQMLIQAQRSLISTGTEGIILGRKFAPGTHWDNWVRYPFYPGYLMAARVLEVGDGVTAFAPGDRVAVRGNHKQFSVVGAEGRILKIPDGVSDEDATWFGLACIVQTGVRRAEHVLGDAIAVVGLGLLGQLVTQYVRALGAREIIAIDTAQPRLDMALSHGATQGLNATSQSAAEDVRRLTEGRGADVVYDVTGHAAAFGPSLGLARKFGKLLLLGDTGTPGEQRLTPDVVTRGVSIIGAHDGHPPEQAGDHLFWTHNNMARLFFTFVERGQMRVNDLVTHRYAPGDAPAAYRMLQTDRTGAMGVVFDWSQAD